MGVREWPQQIKKGSWQEESAAGTELVRYVLEGEGTLTATSADDQQTETASIQPGTLIKVEGPAFLEWESATDDMILLTPNYEQGGILVTVGGGLLLLLVGLVATTST